MPKLLRPILIEDMVFAAVFPALPSGPYRAFASGKHNQVSHVTIRPHEVAEIAWR